MPGSLFILCILDSIVDRHIKRAGQDFLEITGNIDTGRCNNENVM